MSQSISKATQVTVFIPLYKSARFIETIIKNIDAISMPDVEILISDRHCHDETIDFLAERYAGDIRVRCIKYKDELDWVEHINSLIQEAKGEYIRFLPHDDISPSGSLEALIAAMETNPDAVLAYGPTKAIDGGGERLPERDDTTPHPNEAKDDWTLGAVLQMFWKGYFNGAFKGLIRRRVVRENNLFIRHTKDQIFPERCWLFALCLLGRFHFVSDAMYIKRFYDGSVHTSWAPKSHNIYSATETMSKYLFDLVGPGPVHSYSSEDLWLNAKNVAKWIDEGVGKRPQYLPNTSVQKDWIRSLSLPLADADCLK